MLFFAPVFTLIPGFGPQHRALFKFHTNSPWPRLEFIRGQGRGAFRKRKGGGSTYAEIRRGVHQASVHCYLKMAMVACGDAGNADGGDLLAARNGGARAHQ